MSSHTAEVPELSVPLIDPDPPPQEQHIVSALKSVSLKADEQPQMFAVYHTQVSPYESVAPLSVSVHYPTVVGGMTGSDVFNSAFGLVEPA